jgi:putative SOS response-associated peptidase YedK
MCGRYGLRQVAEAEKYFKVHGTPWKVSYNIAPTQLVPVVRIRDGERVGEVLRWGLIPFFARGAPPKGSTINARIETLETAPSYKGAWARGQRCLQVASGFYEWHTDEQNRRSPYFIQVKDAPFIAFAGLWDRSRKEDGAWIESCVHITMPGNDLLRQVHNGGANPYRMPAILRPEDYEAWLEGTADEARAALRQYPSKRMQAYEVSTKVNSPKNDEPDLLEPVTGELKG